jgi:ferredoxin hydrogenase large subunit
MNGKEKNMITNDRTTSNITKRIFREVARLAWNGELEEKKDFLPETIIPGPLPQFRCCIYREREIIRQRVRLASGRCPDKKETKNIVQVIPAACDDCAISSYSVTDNCHGCLGRACRESCRFDAISIIREHGRIRAYIDPTKCRECGMCAKNCPYQVIVHQVRPCKQACPVNAITMDETTGLCVIDESKCIQCGHCIHACPFGGLGAKAFIVDVIRAIREGKRVYAMVAPAVEGQFGPDITPTPGVRRLKRPVSRI